MRPLRSAELLEIWDRGQDLHPIDRALVVLAFADAGRSWEELAALPIGERNRLLLTARALSFGAQLDLVAACPACSVELEFEFSFPLAELAAVAPVEIETELAGGSRLRLRLPDSRDLAALVPIQDPRRAREAVVSRCTIAVTHDAEPEAISVAFSHAVERHDPLAVIAFPVTCGDCGQAWRSMFDPVDYTWRQIAQHAAALTREVHTLARAYGWSEGEVLRLSPARRRRYIEQVGA